MKRFITLTAAIAIFALIWIPISVYAGDNAPSITVPLTTPPKEKPPILRNDSPKGHRMPQRPFYCTISGTEGIDIPGMDASQITDFEIYDADGVCIGAFSDEHGFITFLFSLSGQFEIRFHFDEYVLHGYIYL